MAKYKVLKKFRDMHTKDVYIKNIIIEMDDERANEAIENLKKYDGEFLKRIDDEDERGDAEIKDDEQVEGIDADDMTIPQIKQALDQLQVKYKSNATRDDLLALLESVGQEETEKEGD